MGRGSWLTSQVSHEKLSAMVVHSVLPDPFFRELNAPLAAAGITHVPHGYEAPVWAAEVAARDREAIALIGPFRSDDVAEAVEATAPAGLPLIAPVATWAGVTRDDEPGCVDPARHQGTIVRLVARDTEVARRLAAHLRGRRALVIAGDHDYGRQLDAQLGLAGLERTDDPSSADVVVLAGLAGEPEIERARALAPLPVIAFDGIQGADLGEGRDVRLAMPYLDPAEPVRRAAELVAAAVADGAADRGAVLARLRELGRFDRHGDPVDPPVWLCTPEMAQSTGI
jgi:hypothetical protein